VRHLFTSAMSAQEETDSILNTPRTNVFEGVSAAEDAHQVLVSTNNDLVSAKQVTAEVRARQWIGQMSDISLQHLAQARGIDSAERPTVDRAIEPETERAVNFVQYGAGYKLERGRV
jgi:hypothetical protein